MPRPVKRERITSDVDYTKVESRTGNASRPEFVSSVSRWADTTWVFDGRAVGAPLTTVTCIWDFELSDGATLFAPQHVQLLNEARHFFWSLYSDRRNGRALKASGAGVIFGGLRRLLKWMVEHNYVSFGELDNRASNRFCDWSVDFYATPSGRVDDELDADVTAASLSEAELTAEMQAESELAVDDTDDESYQRELDDADVSDQDGSQAEDESAELENVVGVTPGTIRNSLSTWRFLWEQRLAMARLGLPSMQEPPFSGRRAYKVAMDLATKVTARIPALPDAVAIPLMNAAHQFIETASDDLIMAVAGVYKVRARAPIGASLNPAKNADVARFLYYFDFSTPAGADEPWHTPLGLTGSESIEELRRLVDVLIDACSLIIQAETGMRLGEIAAIESGWNDEASLPKCVTRRTSKSGMLDLYYLSSTLTKLRPAPVEEQWLLAAAPRGTTALPDAVRAVVVLEKLLAPFRAIAAPEIRKYLLVTIGVPRSFPVSGAGVTEPNGHLIRLGQKQFAESHVDWSEIPITEQSRPYIESSGRCIRTHQWRKTYAQYVFQVDRRMLPAIARQFKHLSLAMTEGAYVGTSASLVSGVAEFNRNLTTEFFLANVRGTAPKQEGRLAKLMAQYQPELKKIVEGLTHGEARQAIDAWCRNRDMKIFFHGYGKCIPAIAPTKAECHKRAHTVHWANKTPNFAQREASICTGCYLFMAGQENIDYWTTRFVENMRTWMQAERDGRGKEYRVAQVRAEQARSYLVSLGAPLPVVDLLEDSYAG